MLSSTDGRVWDHMHTNPDDVGFLVWVLGRLANVSDTAHGSEQGIWQKGPMGAYVLSVHAYT